MSFTVIFRVARHPAPWLDAADAGRPPVCQTTGQELGGVGAGSTGTQTGTRHGIRCAGLSAWHPHYQPLGSTWKVSFGGTYGWAGTAPDPTSNSRLALVAGRRRPPIMTACL